jgi:chromosomal replication initiation ATPase DnaA
VHVVQQGGDVDGGSSRSDALLEVSSPGDAAEHEAEPEVKVHREIPRYQRRGIQPSPEQVIGKVAGTYKVPKEGVLRGVRCKQNEARKVAMYLVRRCCDRTLSETARLFGLGSYGAVGWGCHGVRTRMEREKKFRDRIEKIATAIDQQEI